MYSQIAKKWTANTNGIILVNSFKSETLKFFKDYLSLVKRIIVRETHNMFLFKFSILNGLIIVIFGFIKRCYIFYRLLTFVRSNGG